MAFFPESNLNEVLRAQNPWWVTGNLPRHVGQTQARPHDVRFAENERPLLLVGPRRSGKTATLMRLIDGQLRAGRRPRDVGYLPMDHPLLRMVPLGMLVDQALRLMEPDARPLILLDGLQSLREWPERFVELVKTRPHPRLIAAAAVAPGDHDDCYEIVTMPPLTFPEFCALRGLPDLDATPLNLFAPQLPAEADAADDYLFDRVLDPVLADYLVRGGFPEAVFEPDLSVAYRCIRDSVVARAVYQDLPGVVGVAKVAEVERVLLATQLHGDAPLQIESFADAVELDRQTVTRYLEHLSRAFLLTTLKNYAATTDRSRPRVFPCDPALPNALLERGAGVLADPEARRGLLAATVVSHVREAVFAQGLDTAYFREGELEADLIVVSPEGVVPIVIVDREEIDEEDAARVAKVMKRVQAPSAFLLSRARPRRKTPVSFFESVYHMPAAYFLYALRA